MTTIFSTTKYKSAANHFRSLGRLIVRAVQANPALPLGSLALRRKEVEQVLRQVVDGSVVVQARHSSLSKPTNFFNVLLTPARMLFLLAPKIRAVCSLETQTRLQGGVDALIVASQRLRTSRQRSSKSFAPLEQKRLPPAPEKPAVSISMTRARLHANFQLPL